MTSIPPTVDDSDWEPDGVALQVRFCEGGGTYRSKGFRRYSPTRDRDNTKRMPGLDDSAV